jgi:hypothetical protein
MKIVAVALVAIFLVIVWMARNKAEYQVAQPANIVLFTDSKCEGCDKMEFQVRQRLSNKGAQISYPGEALYNQNISPGDELPQLLVDGEWYKGIREVQQKVLDTIVR